MSYKIGEKVPYTGIYRCRECGEAQAYKKGEKFQDCLNDPGDPEILWTLIDRE